MQLQRALGGRAGVVQMRQLAAALQRRPEAAGTVQRVEPEEEMLLSERLAGWHERYPDVTDWAAWLAAKENLILFPEGTRTPNGELLAAKSGVGLTVVTSIAPVVPVRVFGTFNALNRSQSFPRPRPVGVTFGRPIDFSGQRKEATICPK